MKTNIRKLTWVAPTLIFASVLASPSAFAWGGHAVIVFNKNTGGWGSAHGESNRFDAEIDALANCGERCAGIDATSLENGIAGVKETMAYNGWVAIAFGNHSWGISNYPYNQEGAETSAVDNCGGAANGCTVIRSISSFNDQDDLPGFGG